jgi:hypothetical protein
LPVIAPGATIGILGGGQLGRMIALAAARLGYRCHVFAPEADLPAAQVSAATTRAAYDDAAALRAFAAQVSVVTYEFENVPVETVRLLEPLVPVRPGARSLEIAQDRLNEKSFAAALGIGTAPYAPVDDLAGLEAARRRRSSRRASTSSARSRSSSRAASMARWRPSCRSRTVMSMASSRSPPRRPTFRPRWPPRPRSWRAASPTRSIMWGCSASSCS